MAMDVSIIIPFRDKPELLNNCLQTMSRFSIEETRLQTEFLLVNNGSTQESLAQLTIPEGLNCRRIDAPIPFNFQTLVNIGASQAQGQFLLLLNNDIVLTQDSKGFLEKLVELAKEPQIGAVGPLLFYEDGTIQHAGVVVGMGGYADHLYRTWTVEQTQRFPFTAYDAIRPVSAVTAACLMIEAKKFKKIGGFNERFIVCGGDVDFCLRLTEAGYENYYRGDASLIHLESKSRNPSNIPEVDFSESQASYSRYLNRYEGRDPYYPEPLPLTFEPKPEFLTRVQRQSGQRIENNLAPKATIAAPPSAVWRRKARRLKERLQHESPEHVFADISIKIRRKMFGQTQFPMAVERTIESFMLPHTVPIRFHKEPSFKALARLNILLPHLDQKGLYGGIATAALIGLKLKLLHPEIELRFLLTDGGGSITALDAVMKPIFGEAYDRIAYELIPLYDRKVHSVGVHSRDVFVATAWWTCFSAQKICQDRPFIYLIQDYEPCFYPWGEEYAGAASTYKMNFIPIFNTEVLKEFFSAQDILPKSQIDSGAFFNPAIDEALFKPKGDSTLPQNRKKRLFFYGRPSVARNLFATGVIALARAIDEGIIDPEEWEFISAGEPHDPVKLRKGVYLTSLGKISYQAYADLLKNIDIGLSLMLSPHPSYPPLEIASVGSLCVTNSYENKDLSTWHPNIISCQPSPEGVVQGLKLAVERLLSNSVVSPWLAMEQSKICYNWDMSLRQTLSLISEVCRNA
jgi:GT2 family glycosyltransferase